MKGIGTSTGMHVAKKGSAGETGGEPPPLPFLSEDVTKALLHVTAGPVPAKSHFVGRATLDMYASENAWEAYGRFDQPFPPGSLLVAHHLSTTPGEAPLGTYVMQKLESDAGADGAWRFVVVDEKGAVVADGTLAACLNCHREAARDYVFPVGN